MHDATEKAVSRLLRTRADRVDVGFHDVGHVVRRARRRRSVKAAVSSGAALGVVMAAVVGIAVYRDAPSTRAAGEANTSHALGEPLKFARPIASGDHAGVPWWLFDSENSENCPALGLGDRFELGAMGPSCSDRIRPRDLHFSRAAVDLDGFEHFSPLYGVVGEDIDMLWVRMGEKTLKPAFYADDDPGLRYFLLILDSPTAGGRVHALNASGETVRSMPLCVPMREPQRMQVCSEVTDH